MPFAHPSADLVCVDRSSRTGLLTSPVTTLTLAMSFVVTLTLLGHDPTLGSAEALALLTAVNKLSR